MQRQPGDYFFSIFAGDLDTTDVVGGGDDFGINLLIRCGGRDYKRLGGGRWEPVKAKDSGGRGMDSTGKGVVGGTYNRLPLLAVYDLVKASAEHVAGFEGGSGHLDVGYSSLGECNTVRVEPISDSGHVRGFGRSQAIESILGEELAVVCRVRIVDIKSDAGGFFDALLLDNNGEGYDARSRGRYGALNPAVGIERFVVGHRGCGHGEEQGTKLRPS